MNNHLPVNPSEQADDSWETTVRDIARDFTYPSTPDIARRTSQRLIKPRRPVVGVLKMAAVVLLALTVVIVSVPEARAFVVEIIRIGAIQIFIGQPTVTPMAIPPATGTPTANPPQPTRLELSSALEMPNETTLEEATKQLKSTILLPTYPAGLGKPDHVYVQQFPPGVLVTLVWVKPGEREQAWLTIDILNDRLVASKFIQDDGQHQAVKVNNTGAEWLTGLHQVAFFGGKMPIFRKVSGNVLIWLVGQYGKITYRLEGASSLEEAIRIAESLHDAGTP
jgi:hypothetical protein